MNFIHNFKKDEYIPFKKKNSDSDEIEKNVIPPYELQQAFEFLNR